MKVLHVVPDTQDKGALFKSQIDSLNKNGLTCDVFPLAGKGKVKYIKNIKRLKSFLLSRDYDIVHAHHAYTGWTSRMATKLPFVVSYMGSVIYVHVNINGIYNLRTILLHKI